MITEVRVPEIGSDPAEPISVSVWFADEGDPVFEGDRLVELLVGSVTFDVSAPADGRLAEQRAGDNEIVREGDIVAIVETEVDSGE
jgi:pyruvate/2-oxoglutarate dehydrogenase complex dihydrolipoamide acyltransferase (E2) component